MHCLMDYLFSMGHTKIAYICGDSNSVTRQRLAAYYRSMEEHGITVPDEYVRPALCRDLTKAYELTEELLKLKDPPTCILLSGRCSLLRRNQCDQNKRTCDTRGYIGSRYDGDKAAQYEEPRLTTYGQNIEEMGREAALRLIEEIEHPMTTVPGIHTVSGI